MPPETVAKHEVIISSDPLGAPPHRDSLFGEFAWLYILYREWIFRDDTDRIIAAVWPTGTPEPGTKLVELGCGPGFYSRRLASRFPQLHVIGIDRSRRQLQYARDKAEALGLTNCRFERKDVLEVTSPDSTYDAVIASRLFTVLPEYERVMAEIHRALRSGGKCFIAEPRYAFWASIPLFLLWVTATFSRRQRVCREPKRANVFKRSDFEKVFQSQPWRTVRIWRDGRYQYALCEKG